MKLVFKNYPLPNHRFAMPAATAALAAGEQGKFWAFHDRLFDNFSQISEELIDQIAGDLGLDPDRFHRDEKNEEIRKRIVKDIQDGAKAGVRGTPTIFVNGRLLKNRSVAGFQELIDRVRKDVRQTGSAPQ